jgi:hypothetical protein
MVKMVLIAQFLLKSRTGAYIEWLVNEIIMTANKTNLKDELLVMLSAKQRNTQAIQPSISFECRKIYIFPVN